MANYAADVDATTTWDRLTNESNSILVDVRTSAEWAFVGTPDLGSINKNVILEEWQQYPHMNVNLEFAQRVSNAVKSHGGDQSTEVYFLCRSGVRSMAAAAALASLGYTKCFNVTGGFEGPPDSNQHRGAVDGWKARSLPWIQK